MSWVLPIFEAWVGGVGGTERAILVILDDVANAITIQRNTSSSSVSARLGDISGRRRTISRRLKNTSLFPSVYGCRHLSGSFIIGGLAFCRIRLEFEFVSSVIMPGIWHGCILPGEGPGGSPRPDALDR